MGLIILILAYTMMRWKPTGCHSRNLTTSFPPFPDNKRRGQA